MDPCNQVIIAALNPSSYSSIQKQNLHSELLNVLNHYPTLTAACQPYSANQNLTQLVGVLPVFIKRVKYNIPVKLVYPLQYPNDPPIFTVEPTQTMILNLNNKNVSQDGKFKLNVLKKWKKKQATLEVLEEAKKEFEKNTPVLSNGNVAHVQSYPQVNGGGASQPVYQSISQYKQPEPEKKSGGIISTAFGFLSSAINSVENSIKGTKTEPSKVSSSNSQNANPSPYNSVNQPPNPSHPAPSNPPPYNSSNASHHAPSNPQPYNPVPITTSSHTLAVPPVAYSQIVHPKKVPELYILKNVYVQRMKELKEELLLLHTEGEKLKKNKKELDKKFEDFSTEIQGVESKKILLQASIKNTEEWIEIANNQSSEICEDELVEYKNNYAKEFIKLNAKEKAVESTAACLVDAMNKGVVPYKESIAALKGIYSEVFLTARLKEKALQLSQ